MEASNFKFGQLQNERTIPFSYPNLWSVEKTPAYERLVIAPSANHLALLLELTKTLSEPFGILYVLVGSRAVNVEGRYQNPQPASRVEMETFLKEFQDFSEKDARHHVWIASLPDSSTLVYDNHNVIYAYGQLDGFKRVLVAEGLNQGDVRVPVPHTHNYNPMFDAEENRVLSYWDWKHFPLAKGDE
ncbi:MAG: hypothetical protein QOC96_3731 [Acidobacteriota bacterium]|jgi:hypothetical protein|nr:hypothetical protein [Acidobacteriota bacterium]